MNQGSWLPSHFSFFFPLSLLFYCQNNHLQFLLILIFYSLFSTQNQAGNLPCTKILHFTFIAKLLVLGLPWVGMIPWRRKCNPLQYCCPGNSMHRGAWQATVHGVTKESDKSQQLNNLLLVRIVTVLFISLFSRRHRMFKE